MTLSIIIVSYNARADLENCLRSLHEPRPTTPHEIIVVDNASSDGSPDAARRWPDVKVIEAGGNRGFAAGNNIGIGASRGAFLLLLNSDTIVPSGAIDRLLEVSRLHPEAGVIGPRLVDGAGRAELSFGPMLSPIAEWKQKKLIMGHARKDGAVTARIEAMTRREQRPDWVSGACLLVSRADAEAVGLLDERYFMYCEDVDFCAAVRAQGGRVYFSPHARVVHLRGRSRATASVAIDAVYRQSHLAFYRKHHPRWEPFLRLYLALQGKLPPAGTDKKG